MNGGRASRRDTVDFARLRRRMVDDQLTARGIDDSRVLAAMRLVPRETFLPTTLWPRAYEDGPLPIGIGQTISQPFVVALMVQAAAIDDEARVLEVGTGSGYAAAVLGRLADTVDTVERHAALAEAARANLAVAGARNVRVHVGDGSAGWRDDAPYDAIIVAAGSPRVPEALKRQLTVGGRLVIPVGADRRRQTLLKVIRLSLDAWSREDLGPVLFVPLVGAGAWAEGDGTPPGRGPG